MAQLNWREHFDENDNSIWEADGPYSDGFQWRLKQAIHENRIVWYEAHDAELIGDYPETWPTLEAAKRAIELAHDNVMTDEI